MIKIEDLKVVTVNTPNIESLDDTEQFCFYSALVSWVVDCMKNK